LAATGVAGDWPCDSQPDEVVQWADKLKKWGKERIRWLDWDTSPQTKILM
jgi:hypothetical protein